LTSVEYFQRIDKQTGTGLQNALQFIHPIHTKTENTDIKTMWRYATETGVKSIEGGDTLLKLKEFVLSQLKVAIHCLN
jgi:hypothetical protein